MKTKLAIVVGTVLCFNGLALAQQVPDQSFRPPVTNPAYALGAGPTVCLDEGHNNFHTLDGRFWAFGELLRRDGYEVIASASRVVSEVLLQCEILVISNAQPISGDWNSYPYPTPSAFTEGEIQAVYDWVEGGGNLLLIADHMPLAGAAIELAAVFGVDFTDGFAVDGFDEETFNRPTIFRIEDRTLRPNIITTGRNNDESVTSIRTFIGQAFQAPPTALPLLVLPPSFISLMPERAWQFDSETRRLPVGGWLQGAVMQVDSGRAAFFGEAAMFSAQISGPERNPMGMNAPMAEQNYQFVLNLMHWLSGVLN